MGTEVRGVIIAWSDLDWSIAWADMRLDSITAVPEPSVIPLFSIGGITLVLEGRRRANQITAANAGWRGQFRCRGSRPRPGAAEFWR